MYWELPEEALNFVIFPATLVIWSGKTSVDFTLCLSKQTTEDLFFLPKELFFLQATFKTWQTLFVFVNIFFWKKEQQMFKYASFLCWNLRINFFCVSLNCRLSQLQSWWNQCWTLEEFRAPRNNQLSLFSLKTSFLLSAGYWEWKSCDVWTTASGETTKVLEDKQLIVKPDVFKMKSFSEI